MNIEYIKDIIYQILEIISQSEDEIEVQKKRK